MLEPCGAGANSKTGCAFSQVSKFNIGLDVVYFEDGTVWGNYGYGYAFPNPDGTYARIRTDDSQAAPSPAPTRN